MSPETFTSKVTKKLMNTYIKVKENEQQRKEDEKNQLRIEENRSKDLNVMTYFLSVNNKPIVGIGYQFQFGNVLILDLDGWKQVKGKEVMKSIRYLKGFIWVYDLNDKEKYEENVNELKILMRNNDTNECPVLIYLNHSDLNNKDKGINEFLKFIKEDIKERPCKIQICHCNNLKSIQEGLNWLCNKVYKFDNSI